MDPNAALTNMRNAVAEFRAAESQTIAESPVDEAAHSMADAFEALDGFLTEGGFLPDAWKNDVVEAEIVEDYESRLVEAVREEVAEMVHGDGSLPEPILVVFGATEYANGYFFDANGLIHFGTGIDSVGIEFDRPVESLLSDIACKYAIGSDAGLTVNLRTGAVEFEDYIDHADADADADRIKAKDGASS